MPKLNIVGTIPKKEMHSLSEQLDKHILNSQYSIWPHPKWDLKQYQQFFEYVRLGWLIQGDAGELGNNGFIINPEYEDDPPYE